MDDGFQARTGHDEPDDGLVQSGAEPGEGGRGRRSRAVVAHRLQHLFWDGVYQLGHRRALVPAGLQVAQHLLEPHLTEQPPVPGVWGMPGWPRA